MKLRLLTVFIFWALCSISHSANVNFTNMRLTYNQIDPNNGRTMLQLHYTLTVTGLQGHTLVPVLAVEIPQDGLEGEYIGKMIVTAIHPLKMHANAFGSGYFKNNPTLYVPAGSREDYLSTDGWSDIKNVIEVNFQYE